ncbi:MAG: c-type cytochrome [Bacteroidota bacterium]
MDSNLLASIHLYSVFAFLVIYLVKTVLLFTSTTALDRFTSITKVPEMIVSTLFLATGIWLTVILGGIKTFQIIKLVMVFASIPLAVVGFKRRKKGLAFLSLLLIIGSYGLAEMSRNKPFMKATVVMKGDVNTAVANGMKVYLENCAFCHGKDGKKAYRGAKDISNQASADNVRTKIEQGVKRKMPKYEGVITGKDLDDLCLYVVSMKNNPAQAE